MALGAISGGIYSSEAAAVPQTVKQESSYTQSDGTVNLNITDAEPVVIPTGSSQTGNEPENGQKERSASEKQIKNAISKANNTMREHLTRCEFKYHEETKRISIKVIDSETEEVIREIPPEDTLKMIEKMWEMAGILVDERR